jgi:hypothetical protein
MKYNKFSSCVTLIRHKILDNSRSREEQQKAVGAPLSGTDYNNDISVIKPFNPFLFHILTHVSSVLIK